MITQWMLYGLLFSTLLTAAALLVEGALIRLRLPIRWVWVAAIGGNLWAPAFILWRSTIASVGPAAGELSLGAVQVLDPTAPGSEAVMPWSIDPTVLLALDGPMLTMWGLGSLAMLVTLVISHHNLRLRRRSWRGSVMAGTPVLVSADTGPAVVGIRRPTIVVPGWAERLDGAQQRLLLAHEVEHVRAGDPRLLLMGLGFLVLVPWNPLIWFQVRRLRSAIEIDCDARVLRVASDVGAYGALLLEVGRRSTRTPLAAAAFSEASSQLERRIRMLIRGRNRRGWVTAAMGCAGAAAVLLVSCEVPQPQPVATDGDTPGVEVEATAPDEVSPGGDEVEVQPGEEVLTERRTVASAQAAPDAERAATPAPVRERQSSTGASSGGTPSPVASNAQLADTIIPRITPMEVLPQLRNTSVILREVQNRYPPMLRDAGIGGTATLWVDVGEDGAVREVRVQNSSGQSQLDLVAEQVMRLAEFTPASNRGEPVRVWIQIPVLFRVD